MKFAALLICVCALFAYPVSADDEIGIKVYPNATEMPQATQRLLEKKGPTWLAARVYRTSDSIKDVAKYFREQAPKPVVSDNDDLVKRLLVDNWKVTEGTVPGAYALFGVGDVLRKASKEKAKTSFGVFVLKDSIVRVHLMSPYPSEANNNTLDDGTMILMIRERPADTTDSAGEEETVYTGRDVTLRVRIRNKPHPFHPGAVRGSVVLKAVLSGSGKVTKIIIVQGVPGLTEEAIKAARRLEFDPAIKDGKFVAMWVQLEYNFF